MNAKKIALEYDFIVEISKKMQRIRLGVSDLGDWAQGNEEIKTILKVILVF